MAMIVVSKLLWLNLFYASYMMSAWHGFPSSHGFMYFWDDVAWLKNFWGSQNTFICYIFRFALYIFLCMMMILMSLASTPWINWRPFSLGWGWHIISPSAPFVLAYIWRNCYITLLVDGLTLGFLLMIWHGGTHGRSNVCTVDEGQWTIPPHWTHRRLEGLPRLGIYWWET